MVEMMPVDVLEEVARVGSDAERPRRVSCFSRSHYDRHRRRARTWPNRHCTRALSVCGRDGASSSSHAAYLAVRPVSMAVKPSTDAADAAASQRASVAADYGVTRRRVPRARGAVGYTPRIWRSWGRGPRRRLRHTRPFGGSRPGKRARPRLRRGMDCLLAADAVGPAGRVVGVDRERRMLARAGRKPSSRARPAPPGVQAREIENLPCERLGGRGHLQLRRQPLAGQTPGFARGPQGPQARSARSLNAPAFQRS